MMDDQTEGVGAMEIHSTSSESYDNSSIAESDKSQHLEMVLENRHVENGEETCSSYMNDIEADHFDLCNI